MADINYETTLLVDRSPEEVFSRLQHIDQWWYGLYDEMIEGQSLQLQDEFTFRAGNGSHYSRQKLVELQPNQRLAWLVTDSNLTFAHPADEWTNTKISFDISREGDKTKVTFRHEGLTPRLECYDGCSAGWSKYMSKLGDSLN